MRKCAIYDAIQKSKHGCAFSFRILCKSADKIFLGNHYFCITEFIFQIFASDADMTKSLVFWELIIFKERILSFLHVADFFFDKLEVRKLHSNSRM